MQNRCVRIAFTIAAGLALSALAGCGGTGPATFHTGGGGALSVIVSGTNTCASGAGGPYSHIYLTITDVQASTIANAPSGDSSFVDVTPGLKNAPKVVDLLGAQNQCSLATLAANVSLNTATYLQFRVVLAADGAAPAGSPCGTFGNCVVPANSATPVDLQTGTESSQGIQVAANATSTIAGGSFTPTGSTQTLALVFNSCSSVIPSSTGTYRLRPVLMAGDATSLATVSGVLADSGTQQPVSSGRFLVALESADSRSVDRVVIDTRPDANGNFSLCPVMAGTYDVVASGVRTDTNVAYAATMTLGVQAGANLGTVPVVATSGSPASVLGVVDTSAAVGTPTSADVVISALQTTGTGNTIATVPLLNGNSSTVTGETAASGTCASGTDCASFGIEVPAAMPAVGQFSSTGTQYVQSSSIPSFQIEGTTFAPLTGGQTSCTPFYQFSSLSALTAGGTFDLSAQPLSFIGCQ
jgi:hypothetical protein